MLLNRKEGHILMNHGKRLDLALLENCEIAFDIEFTIVVTG
jgi:hypothetical protein